MTSSYGHVLERQPALGGRLDSPGNLDTLQAKKNFSVSHLLDLEEAGDMVAAQADESVGEAGRSLLESPGLTSGSDTPQQDSVVSEPKSQIPQERESHAGQQKRFPPQILLRGRDCCGAAHRASSCSTTHRLSLLGDGLSVQILVPPKMLFTRGAS